MRRVTGVLVVLALACTVSQKREAVEVGTADPGRRQELFEATLRVLDEKPEYVDEFFQQAKKHPATLGRFLRNTAGELQASRQLTEWTAAELVREPGSLEAILVATLDAAAERKPAREAIARAIGERPALAARALAERPEVALAVTKELGALGGHSLVDRIKSALGGEPEPSR